MAYYIKIDYPDITANEAITRSRQMMKGYKWALFKLDLSFIGWYLFCLVTRGVGTVWIVPYVAAAKTAFYEELRARQDPFPKTTNISGIIF